MINILCGVCVRVWPLKHLCLEHLYVGGSPTPVSVSLVCPVDPQTPEAVWRPPTNTHMIRTAVNIPSTHPPTHRLVHSSCHTHTHTHTAFTVHTCTSPSFRSTACSNWWSPRVSIRHSEWIKAAAPGPICPVSSFEASRARSESIWIECMFSSRSWASDWESGSMVGLLQECKCAIWPKLILMLCTLGI